MSNSGQTHTSTHSFALWVVRNVKKYTTLSVIESKWKWYSVRQEPTLCKMYHHRTQHPQHSSVPTASKQPSQTGATGRKLCSSSHHSTRSIFPPPSHHYIGHALHLEGTKVPLQTQCRIGACYAYCFAQRHRCVFCSAERRDEEESKRKKTWATRRQH